MGIEPDDIHSSTKVVLQRQFFEAVVRAASVKYANSSELSTLAQKLDHLFNVHLSPMIASKNKAKSNEEEVSGLKRLASSKVNPLCLTKHLIIHDFFVHRNNSK